MGATTDVPGVYDLVIQVNGGGATTGFLLDDALESSLPFRTHKAIYTHTPTFIERSNVSGDYGDNQQDFYMTATQRDWSLGQDQKYFRSSDGQSVSRFWAGANADVRTPGQVAMYCPSTALTFAAAVKSMASDPIGLSGNSVLPAATTTNLYTIDNSANITDRGAHGLGSAPNHFGCCTDGVNVYLSANKTDNPSCVGVRKWTGIAYSTWSAWGSDSLCYLNNTLYGLSYDGGQFVKFDTFGNASTIFQFKDASGGGLRIGQNNLQGSKVFPFGGKVGILLVPSPTSAQTQSSLWFYDGNGVSLAAQFPQGFTPFDACASAGTVFISGSFNRAGQAVGAIYYYTGGNLNKLWETPRNSPTATALSPWYGGLLFADSANSDLLYYNATSGGTTIVSDSWNGTSFLGATPAFVAGANSGSTAGSWYSEQSVGAATSASIQTSLFDFDSSLTKMFRGVTVEFDAGTDGNGGTVDIAYRLNDLNSTYTNLQTGATSGSEYSLSGHAGRSVSVKVTLNKGTSTAGPVLKKIMVGAAPIQNTFRTREYILNCSGNPTSETDKLVLRNGDVHPLSGRAQVDQLVTASENIKTDATKYLTVTDRLGTFNAIIETLEVYEQHASVKTDPSKSGSFICKVAVREI